MTTGEAPAAAPAGAPLSHAGGLEPRVSAIVISYHTGPVLRRCVASLRAQEGVGEVILVDNGNPPGEIEKAAAQGDGAAAAPARILSGHGNIGFAAACNRGAAAARAEILLFFNPDAVMPPGGVRRLLAGASDLARPWMTGAKLVDPDGAEQQGSRRDVLTPWRAIVEAGRLYRLAPGHALLRRFNLHEEECPDEVAETPTLSGACFMLPRADYDAVGGMDERYFLHVEDVDFCLRFARAGGRIYFNPHVAVVHYKSSSRANPLRIEASKTAGLARYFNTHFAGACPAPFLWLVIAALWVNFGLLAMRRGSGRALRLAGVLRRGGARAARRARAMMAGRNAR